MKKLIADGASVVVLLFALPLSVLFLICRAASELARDWERIIFKHVGRK